MLAADVVADLLAELVEDVAHLAPPAHAAIARVGARLDDRLARDRLEALAVGEIVHHHRLHRLVRVADEELAVALGVGRVHAEPSRHHADALEVQLGAGEDHRLPLAQAFRGEVARARGEHLVVGAELQEMARVGRLARRVAPVGRIDDAVQS